MNEEKLDRSGSQPGKEILFEGGDNLDIKKCSIVTIAEMDMCNEFLNDWRNGRITDQECIKAIVEVLHPSKPNQPSQPGEGKEDWKIKLDKRLDTLEHYLSSEAFGELANGASKAHSVVWLLKQDLLSLFKSRPSEGWRDSDMREAWKASFLKGNLGVKFNEWFPEYQKLKSQTEQK